MQQNITKGLVKILTEFSRLSSFPKTVIKYGSRVFLALFALGTILVVLNHTALNFDSDFEFAATSIIKSSFIIFAEVVIGSLVMDYVFIKK